MLWNRCSINKQLGRFTAESDQTPRFFLKQFEINADDSEKLNCQFSFTTRKPTSSYPWLQSLLSDLFSVRLLVFGSFHDPVRIHRGDTIVGIAAHISVLWHMARRQFPFRFSGETIAGFIIFAGKPGAVGFRVLKGDLNNRIILLAFRIVTVRPALWSGMSRLSKEPPHIAWAVCYFVKSFKSSTTSDNMFAP